MTRRVAQHRQFWCDVCIEPDGAPCDGEHVHYEGVRTEVDGNTSVEVSVGSTWIEQDVDGAPRVEVQISSYRGELGCQTERTSSFVYLTLADALKLQTAIEVAVVNVRTILTADHHVLCDCATGGDGQ